MANGNFTPATVVSFTMAFLATDYLWYKKENKYINSIVWARVLGGNDGKAKYSSSS